MHSIIKGVFPDYFPTEFNNLLPENAKEQELDVFRIGKYGKNNKEAFLDSYGEVYLGIRKVRNKEKWLNKNKNNIEMLSTSFFELYEDIKYIFDITLKDLPEKILLFGKIPKEIGVSQYTKDRNKRESHSHVDVWIYKNAAPEMNFNIYKEGENNE